MRTKETTVYNFDELSEEAKEKAREWWLEGAFYFEWWENVYEVAANIAEILGINLRQRSVGLMGGGTRLDPEIYFDTDRNRGAAFGSSYSYKPGSVKAIKEYAPQDAELHRIAKELQDIQKKNFYQLTTTTSTTGRGGNWLEVDTVSRYDDKEPTEDAQDTVEECLKDFAHWIMSMLEKEMDWISSEENIDDSIRNNEYEFTEDGNIA